MTAEKKIKIKENIYLTFEKLEQTNRSGHFLEKVKNWKSNKKSWSYKSWKKSLLSPCSIKDSPGLISLYISTCGTFEENMRQSSSQAHWNALWKSQICVRIDEDVRRNFHWEKLEDLSVIFSPRCFPSFPSNFRFVENLSFAIFPFLFVLMSGVRLLRKPS